MVSVADVYDALTSVRAYKDAIPHKEAIQMILDGKCGTFNPLLLDCLLEVQDRIAETLARPADVVASQQYNERDFACFRPNGWRHGAAQ